MSEVNLTVETGRVLGSSSSRRLRREGKIPGTVYGMGSEPISFAVTRGDLRTALTTDAGTNALVRLTIDGKEDFAIVNDIQRHPVRRDVSHIDFLRIDPKMAISREIPIVLVGEAKEVSQAGGLVTQIITDLHVLVRPDAIPPHIEVDISKMELDQVLTVGELNLPDGVESEIEPEAAVASAFITRSTIEADAADEAAEAAEAASGAEGDAGGDASSDDSGSDD